MNDSDYEYEKPGKHQPQGDFLWAQSDECATKNPEYLRWPGVGVRKLTPTYSLRHQGSVQEIAYVFFIIFPKHQRIHFLS